MRGHVPAAARKATGIAEMAAGSTLRLSLGLPLRDSHALTNLLERVYDPASREYRRFLTAEEFTQRFGPTERDYAAVQAFLEGQGFKILATHPNRMLVDFSGTVSQIEKAFHVRLKRYRHPAEPREFYAPDLEPELDLDVPVLDISGLDNFVLPRPANLVRREPPFAMHTDTISSPRAMAGSGPGGSYMGNDFRAAYATNVLLSGAGQYVGLVQFDGYYPNDIAVYVTRAGLTNVPLTNILLDGFDGTPGENNVEVALDIEMAIAMAPGLAGILVYEGLSPNSILNRMATDNMAQQLSASWTFGVNSTTTQIFQQFALQGQTYFNASGDDGAYSGAPATPTDNPYITSVGGTTLSTRSPAGAWLSETTWSWYTAGSGTSASGGGISSRWTIPVWQQGMNLSTNGGSTFWRNIPDVSMVADNVFVIADNGQQSFVGGTSVASPLWAAYVALVNQQAALSGLPRVGFINPAIYSIAKGPSYASAFHDVRTGNNTNPASPGAFYAVAGYDLCTGWGTPTGRSLINALAPPPPRPLLMAGGVSLVLETCAPPNGAADPGEAVVMRFAVQNYGGVSTTNLVGTLMAGAGITPLSAPQSYGSIAQGLAVSRQFTLIADGPCGATANASLQLSEGSTDLGVVSFAIPLGAPRNALAESFDSVSVPGLPANWTRGVQNAVSNWVTSTASRDSAPNAVYAPVAPVAGVAELVSPPFMVNSISAQVSFKHSYNLKTDPTEPSSAFDGAVLEMKIGDGPVTDILLAGGSFAQGAYNTFIQANDNPLNNRQGWGGNSGAFITSVVDLPVTAAGQWVQLKWRLGSSGGTSSSFGWYVDSIAVRDGYGCCAVATSTDLALSQSVYPQPAVLGQSLAFGLAVQNFGPGPATGVMLTNLLPGNATFEWASAGYTNLGGAIAWDLGLVPLGWKTNFTLLVRPFSAEAVTNVAFVSTLVEDTNLTNNLAVSAVPIARLPAFTLQPADQRALAGGEVVFRTQATGTEPLRYQWRFQGANLPGETDSELVLTNVQAAQSGVYTVQATNVAGATLSSAATLSVLGPPAITLSAVDLSATNLTVSVSSLAGFGYALEYKDALPDAVWQPIGVVVAGTGGVIALKDTNAVLPSTRFYRVSGSLYDGKR